MTAPKAVANQVSRPGPSVPDSDGAASWLLSPHPVGGRWTSSHAVRPSDDVLPRPRSRGSGLALALWASSVFQTLLEGACRPSRPHEGPGRSLSSPCILPCPRVLPLLALLPPCPRPSLHCLLCPRSPLCGAPAAPRQAPTATSVLSLHAVPAGRSLSICTCSITSGAGSCLTCGCASLTPGTPRERRFCARGEYNTWWAVLGAADSSSVWSLHSQRRRPPPAAGWEPGSGRLPPGNVRPGQATANRTATAPADTEAAAARRVRGSPPPGVPKVRRAGAGEAAGRGGCGSGCRGTRPQPGGPQGRGPACAPGLSWPGLRVRLT